ncbi:flippase, partial [Escherichia coli]|nr:flippase [Escherichia coli]
MLKNIIYLLSVQGGNYIFPLVTLPYLVRILEPTGYGIYGYSFAVVQYFILFIDYGFNYSAPKIISISRENTDSISKVFWNVTFIKIIAASLGLLIIYLISELNIIDYQIKFIILAYISVVGNLIYPVWFFQGLEKMLGIAISMFSARLLTLCLTFLLVKSEKDLGIAITIQSSITVIAGIISTYFLFSLKKIIWVPPSLSKMKELIYDGWHYFISSAAISLYTTSSTIILGALSGTTAVGYFIAADKIRLALQGVIGPITQAVFPRVTYIMKDNHDDGLLLARKVFRWQFSLMLVLSIFLYFFADDIILIMYGKTYHESLEILKVLAFTPAIVTVSNYIAILVMIPIGMKKEFTKIITTSGLIGLLIITYLTNEYSGVGTAIGVIS